MPTSRRILLQDKLAANRARLERERFLAALPQRLTTVLSAAPVVLPPESTRIAARCAISAEGLGAESPIRPPSYLFREFSRPEEVFAALVDYPDRHDERSACLHLFGDGPIYVVRFGWGRARLAELFKFGSSGLLVATAELDAGIVIDHYCGSLPGQPNPSEMVYELGWWG